jgi:hypothetical protein
VGEAEDCEKRRCEGRAAFSKVAQDGFSVAGREQKRDQVDNDAFHALTPGRCEAQAAPMLIFVMAS